MPAPLTPQKKSDIDPNFQRQITSQQSQGLAEGKNRVQDVQCQWNMPDLTGQDESDAAQWDGNLFDSGYTTLGQPFNRDVANQNYEDATSDPENPGMAGDLVVTTTQIDLMSTMERAFRARHCSRFPRMVAHSLGTRKYGHGSETGTFTQSMLNYVQSLLNQMAQ